MCEGNWWNYSSSVIQVLQLSLPQWKHPRLRRHRSSVRLQKTVLGKAVGWTSRMVCVTWLRKTLQSSRRTPEFYRLSFVLEKYEHKWVIQKRENSPELWWDIWSLVPYLVFWNFGICAHEHVWSRKHPYRLYWIWNFRCTVKLMR
jgi:hypothetical protein